MATIHYARTNTKKVRKCEKMRTANIVRDMIPLSISWWSRFLMKCQRNFLCFVRSPSPTIYYMRMAGQNFRQFSHKLEYPSWIGHYDSVSVCDNQHRERSALKCLVTLTEWNFLKNGVNFFFYNWIKFSQKLSGIFLKSE